MLQPVEDASVRLMTRAAVLYYRQGLTQQQVAKRMSVSRATVGRLLTRAEECGIVTIGITSPFERSVETEVALDEAFGLTESMVVEPEDPEDGEAVRRELGRACAQLIAHRLAPGMVIGLGWSRTIRHIGDHLTGPSLSAEAKDVTVVQLDGATVPSDGQQHPILGISTVAARLGAHHVIMPAPLYVEDEATARGLHQDKGVRQALAMGAQADICIFGVGSMSPTTTLVVSGEVDEDLLSELASYGAVGDVFGRYYDADGRPLGGDLARRTISLPLEVLRERPIRVATAAGDTQVEALTAALRSGLANVLVTDSRTASALLRRAGHPSG